MFDRISTDDGPTKAPKANKENHCPMCRSSHNLYRSADFTNFSLVRVRKKRLMNGVSVEIVCVRDTGLEIEWDVPHI